MIQVDETSGMPYVAQVTSKYDEPELDDAIGRQKKWRESGKAMLCFTSMVLMIVPPYEQVCTL